MASEANTASIQKQPDDAVANVIRKTVATPWRRFAYLGRTTWTVSEIGVQGPGKLVHSGLGETTEVRYLPHDLENSAGGNTQSLPDVTSFAANQAKKQRGAELIQNFGCPTGRGTTFLEVAGPKNLLERLSNACVTIVVVK
jgi:hypothetical protein